MTRNLSLTESHLARAFRTVPDPGPQPGFTRLTEAEIAAEGRALLATRPPGPLWVFAYGSLLWKPVFEPARNLHVTAPGWHRQFCIEITGFRGTPEAPGLMMALMPGGRCTGLAQEVAEAGVEAAVIALIAREMPFREILGNARWLRLTSAEGPLSALTFYAGPKGERIRRALPLAQAARQLARACGPGGSGAEYLHQTVRSLAEHGLSDRNLWTLQHLVAQEIDRL